jgi:hypothetical protein
MSVAKTIVSILIGSPFARSASGRAAALPFWDADAVISHPLVQKSRQTS